MYNDPQNYGGSAPLPQTGYNSFPRSGIPAYGEAAYQSPLPRRGFAPDPYEKRNIKRHLAGTFTLGIVHSIGFTILGLILFTALSLSGHEEVYNEEGKRVLDWISELMGYLPGAIMCYSIFFIDKASSKLSLSEYFDTSRISGGKMAGSIAGSMFFYPIGILLMEIIFIAFQAIDLNPVYSDYEVDRTPLLLVMELLMTVIIGPLGEELMFRGVIMRRLSHVSKRLAIFMSAVFFGLMHGNLPQATMAMVVGLVFGYIDMEMQSLLPSVICHTFINATVYAETVVETMVNEEAGNTFFFVLLIIYFIIGLLAMLIMIFGKKLHLPAYSEYHSRRTWPVIVTCISFWILIVCYAAEIITSFSRITE